MMTAEEEAFARYQAAQAQQPKREKPCGTCTHAKRTHARGYYACRAKGCTCQRYERDDAAAERYDAAWATWRDTIYEPARLAYFAALEADRGKHAAGAAGPPPPPPKATTVGGAAALPPPPEGTHVAGSVDCYRFRSFDALCKAAMAEPICPANRERWGTMVSGSGLKDFNRGPDCTGHDLASIIAWLQAGWPAGLEKMRAAIGRLPVPHLSDVRRRGKWSDVGDVLSLDRLYGGNVERCWRTTHRSRAGAPPRLQVLIQATLNGGRSDEALFWLGAPAAALTEAAVAAGYTVAVDVIRCARDNTRGGATYLATTRVKNYDAPANLAVLIAATAHTAAFRTVTFTHMMAGAFDAVAISLGSAAEPGLDELRDRGLLDIGAIPFVIPASCTTDTAAKAWLRTATAHLEAIGKGAA